MIFATDDYTIYFVISIFKYLFSIPVLNCKDRKDQSWNIFVSLVNFETLNSVRHMLWRPWWTGLYLATPVWAALL